MLIIGFPQFDPQPVDPVVPDFALKAQRKMSGIRK
jgi:hypothetical protein